MTNAQDVKQESESEPKKSSFSTGCLFLVVAFVIFVIMLQLSKAGHRNNGGGGSSTTPSVYGTLEWPDGEEETGMKINLFTDPVNRNSVACSVNHGTGAKLIECGTYDGVQRCKVSVSGCTGWVHADFFKRR